MWGDAISKNDSMNKYLKLLLKLTFAAGSIYWVFSTIDVELFLHHIQNINIPLAFGCFMSLVIGQVVSSRRMRYYFSTENIALSKYQAMSLYFIGSFWNLILPGGIGGDAYKVLLIAKKRNFSKKIALQRIVSSRASGLLALIVLTGIGALFSSLTANIPFGYYLVVLGIIGVFPCYFFCVKKILREQPKVALGAMGYSFVIQGLCVVSAVFLLYALNIDAGNYDLLLNYTILFLISSIISIIPISIGGVGLREASFLYGATIMGVSPEFGVGFAFVYFLVNMCVSLIGAYFFFHDKFE